MEEVGIESRIQQAMRSRVQHFREQADSLTFEGVRRLLEKDMDLDTYALDVHKRYVKQLLEKYLSDTKDDDISKESGETTVDTVEREEAEQPEEHQPKEDVKDLISDDEEKMEDSPVMGLLTGNESAKSENLETQGNKKKGTPSVSTIKKAIWKRAAYFRAKSDEITVAGVRRLLEEDLELDKCSLDIFKKLISDELDEVLSSPKISKSPIPVKKKSSVNSQSRILKKISSKGSSDSLDSGSDDEENEVKPKQKNAPKGKVKKSEELKKRKRPTKETPVSRKKQNKLAEETSEDNINAESGDESEDGQPQSSGEKPLKKKEVLPPAYGKRVEQLKSIIKSCGMSVAPLVYKKAKQVPDNKREAFVIKELEDILSREGLSTDPTEKEIKEVKRRKERAKELEGIDTSNIVLSSRRRSTASFVAPPKPKVPVESDGDDTEDTDNDDGDDDDDDDDNDNDDDDSQSEDQEENENSD